MMSLRTILGTTVVSLILVGAQAPSAQAAVPAGQLMFSIGGVKAVDAEGVGRRLRRGAKIFSGDTINTASNGRAQLRFSDGSFVSLVPNTEFEIEDYAFGEEAEEERGFFKLLKGGLRTLTGKIGKKFRKNYQLATPVATIGIRGTWFRAALSESDGHLDVSVGFDPDDPSGIVVTNDAGEIELDQGENARVDSADTPPERAEGGVVLAVAPPPAVEPAFSEGNVEQVALADTTAAVDTTGVVLSGLIYAQADNATIFPGLQVDRATNVSVVLGSPPVGGIGTELIGGARVVIAADVDKLLANAAGDPALLAELQTFVNAASPADLAANRANPSVAMDFFDDGVIQVWRWTGGNLLFIDDEFSGIESEIDAHTGFQSHHAVALAPANTPLPTMGTATYTFIPGSGTPSTSQDGLTIGTGITGGTLDVEFGPSPNVQLNVSVSHNPTLNLQGFVDIDPSTQTFGNDVGGSAFATGGSCSPSCNAKVAGVIDTGRAGLVGVIEDLNGDLNNDDSIHFAGAFKK